MKTLAKRTLKYLGTIVAICLGISTLAFFLFNKKELTYADIAINWSFYIVTILFCYSTLAFITEQGLFNGLRYSTNAVRASISKKHSYEMMEQNHITDKDELKDFMKEKYLYTRPKFYSTYPLMISSTFLFVLGFYISFNFY